MNQIPEIKISESKSLAKSITSDSGSVIKQASSTMSDIISLISKGEQLAGHIENIVGMFKKGDGAGSSIIQSQGLPPVTSRQEMPPTSSKASAPDINDKSMETYFSSPEGLKKIADAIDKMVPLIGDLKLSEVKKAIMDTIPSTETKINKEEVKT